MERLRRKDWNMNIELWRPRMITRTLEWRVQLSKTLERIVKDAEESLSRSYRSEF